jgi:hypothetical protein
MTLSPESRNSSGELTRLPDFTIPPYALSHAPACQASVRVPDAQRFYLKFAPQNRVELALPLIYRLSPNP